MKGNHQRLRRWEMALLVGLAAAMLTGSWAGAAQDRLAGQVLRLHVIANSDSQEAMIPRGADLAETEAALSRGLEELARTAAEVVAREGYRYPVSVSLETDWFPTKEYDGFSLPAGSYRALRVVLGEGDGRNWWCVVFPPLCLSSVTEVADTALAAGLGEEDVRLITGESGGYVVKFKCIELWEEFQGWLAGEAG